MRSARAFLLCHTVSASAPCRVDLGGHWDIPVLALPFHRAGPCTVNAAIDLRAVVTLHPHTPDRVKVTSLDFACEEEHRADRIRLDSPLALVFGMVQFFGLSGLRVEVSSQAPPMSGLGGSAALGIATCAALSELLRRTGDRGLTRREMVRLTHLLEAGLSAAHTGVQDEAAAAFGGVNLWDWKPFPRPAEFKRTALVPARRAGAFDRRFLVAYCGKGHRSGTLNARSVEGFLRAEGRREWMEMNELTREFARCLRTGDWKAAVRVMSRETKLRRKNLPGVVAPLAGRLIASAESLGCAARFTGAGGGGSVWALGEPDAMPALRSDWQRILGRTLSARLLDCRIDFSGTIVEVSRRARGR